MRSIALLFMPPSNGWPQRGHARLFRIHRLPFLSARSNKDDEEIELPELGASYAVAEYESFDNDHSGSGHSNFIFFINNGGILMPSAPV